METFAPTERTTLKRLAKRGNFDRDVVYGILDEAFICHVGFIVEGRPVVIPTAYGRVGDRFYLHGSAANRMLRTAETGVDICVTVTLVDGLVLARSAFHHSINYRSVVIFGRALVVEDSREKFEALRSFTQHVVPNRWSDVREPTDSELKATIVLYLELMEVSAKVRTGPPIDDEDDYAMPVWAGEIPLRLVAGVPVSDPRLPPGIDPPQYVRDYSRPAPESDPT